MKHEDLLSIVITFVMGIIAGFYLYFIADTTYFNNDSIPDLDTLSELTIDSQAYGGCREDCPSFQVLNDGSYRFIYTPMVGSDEIVKSGVLPKEIQKKLSRALIPKDLEEESQIVDGFDCRSYSDGIDIKYEIVLYGITYVLDSCYSTIDGEGQLWTALNSIWSHLNEVAGY